MRSALFACALFSAALVPACVDADGDPDLGEADSDLVINGPTTLTFFESANATGKSLTVTLGSTDADERIRLISKNDITNAGLLDKISAVRLSCGARDARVVLFDAWNLSNTSFSSWAHSGDKGATIDCASYQSRTIDLHTSYPALADNVASAFLTTHADNEGLINFMDYFQSVWGYALDTLPSNVTPGRTDIWMVTTSKFEIRQYLSIDYWACTKRGAVFEYSVTMHEDGTFGATIVDSYVDYGTGDAWGCHDNMLATLKSSLADATPKLTGALDQLIAALAPNMPHYYFVPDVHLWTFDLFYRQPIVNAPL